MGFWYLFVKNKKEWLYDDVEEKNIISFICIKLFVEVWK